MRWMCDAHGLPEASRSWRTTLILFLVVWVIPLGGVQIAVLVAMATGSPWQMDFGPAVILFVPLVLLVVFAPIAGQATDRFGARPVTVVGMALLTIGYAALEECGPLVRRQRARGLIAEVAREWKRCQVFVTSRPEALRSRCTRA